MDALTLLTLPPDTAVHVRGCFVRCPACALDKMTDNPEVRARLHNDELTIGAMVEPAEARDFPQCPTCDRPLDYEVVHHG